MPKRFYDQNQLKQMYVSEPRYSLGGPSHSRGLKNQNSIHPRRVSDSGHRPVHLRKPWTSAGENEPAARQSGQMGGWGRRGGGTEGGGGWTVLPAQHGLALHPTRAIWLASSSSLRFLPVLPVAQPPRHRPSAPPALGLWPEGALRCHGKGGHGL